MSAKNHNLMPQSFAFGATLSPTKRNQVNQVITRMHFNGAIEPNITRWNGL